MPDGTAQTVKRGRKFDQVLEGARDVFMKVGFEGASVDEIAKAAKVSKATLYSYFPDKRLLFMEVAKVECRRQADTALETMDMQAPAADVLHDIAVHMVGFFTSDFGQRIFRICVGEADRFPEIGREFYESGPALARDRIADYLRCAHEQGQLDIVDFEFAAEQFAELCKTNLFPRMVFCVNDTFTPAEIERVVNGAVEMFIARYGTKA